MRFFKSRELGALESAVMNVVWTRGESSVHDVSGQLERPLAYTTVMTTLDRLFKKGLLTRRKFERAFLYSAKYSRREWEEQRAGSMLASLLADGNHSSEMLISCLVDAMGQQDAPLLDELERKIRQKRRELQRGQE
jgi:predicted transcriptional regulator